MKYNSGKVNPRACTTASDTSNSLMGHGKSTDSHRDAEVAQNL
jgi:hypothetical protein